MADQRPCIIAVDDDADALGRLRAELERRYDRDYRVVAESSPAAAFETLESMASSGERIAVVLASQWMRELQGSEVLSRVRELSPRTKRALLVSWGEWGHEPRADAIRAAMGSGCIDYYLLKPWRSPDETFHRTMAEFLHEWSRPDETTPNEVTVLAERSSPRGHELRATLDDVPAPRSPRGQPVRSGVALRAACLYL